MRIMFSSCCETGFYREQNEDAVLTCAEDGLGMFLVADGMGGLNKGEVASGMLRNGFMALWQEKLQPGRYTLGFREGLELIETELIRINHEIVAHFGTYETGSTLVLLYVSGPYCACLSCGDSRIYRKRGFRVDQLTQDDTIENRLGNEDDPEEAGKLVEAVGLEERIAYSLNTDRVKHGDLYLLCSDGVYRFVPPGKLKQLLFTGAMASSQEGTIRALVKCVERGGAGDNFSAVAVRVSKE